MSNRGPNSKPASDDEVIVIDDQSNHDGVLVLDGSADDDAVIDLDASASSGIPCSACGSPLDAQDRFCPACGTTNEKFSEQGKKVVQANQASLQCESCGAQIELQEREVSYVCPFCDSTYVIERAGTGVAREAPEFVIGFSLNKQQARERFLQWIREGGFYQPTDLGQIAREDKLHGVYLPFWMFAMLAESDWSARIGQYWYRTETYTTMENGKLVTKTRQVRETEWWPLRGKHHHYHSGYLVSASKGLSQAEAEAIKPYNLPALKRFEPYYLAGWACEEYTVEKEMALQICQAEFLRRERSNVAGFMPGDTHQLNDVRTSFSDVSSDLCLLPIYVINYRYQGKTYRTLINGQTGKISGQKPVVYWRLWLLIGVIAGLVLLLLLIVLAMSAGAAAL